MAKIETPLSDFLPSLPQLEGIVRRLGGGEQARQSWPSIIERLGQTAIDSVRWAIYESGIKSRSGYLMDHVKFDMSLTNYGSVVIDAEYASVLDKGMDMKPYLMNRVVGMDFLDMPGSIFRTVSDRPTKSGKNWVIEPRNFMELAKSKLQMATIQFVEKLQDLASPESSEQYVMPVEELPEISEEYLANFFMTLAPQNDVFQKIASEYTAGEMVGSDIEASQMIGGFERMQEEAAIGQEEMDFYLGMVEAMQDVGA